MYIHIICHYKLYVIVLRFRYNILISTRSGSFRLILNHYFLLYYYYYYLLTYYTLIGVDEISILFIPHILKLLLYNQTFLRISRNLCLFFKFKTLKYIFYESLKK